MYKALLSGVEELGRNDGGRASDDERHSTDGEIDGAVGVGAGNGRRSEGDEAREPGLAEDLGLGGKQIWATLDVKSGRLPCFLSFPGISKVTQVARLKKLIAVASSLRA